MNNPSFSSNAATHRLSWRLRVLGWSDVDALRALKMEASANHPTQFAYAPEDIWEAAAETVCPGLGLRPVDRAIGVFCDGELHGMAEFVRSSGSKSLHVGEMKSVYLRPELRGSGAAKALLSELIEHAADYTTLLCAAVGLDNPAAKTLYAGFGFASYGVHPAMIRVDGQDVPGELLGLRLPRRVTPRAAL